MVKICPLSIETINRDTLDGIVQNVKCLNMITLTHGFVILILNERYIISEYKSMFTIIQVMLI